MFTACGFGASSWYQVEFNQVLYVTRVYVTLDPSCIGTGDTPSLELQFRCWEHDGPKHTRKLAMNTWGDRAVLEASPIQ